MLIFNRTFVSVEFDNDVLAHGAPSDEEAAHHTEEQHHNRNHQRRLRRLSCLL